MKKPINKFYHFILHILTSCSHKEKYDWIQNRQKKKTKKPDLDEEEEKPKGIKSKRDTSKDCKTVFVGNLPVNTDKKVSSFKCHTSRRNCLIKLLKGIVTKLCYVTKTCELCISFITWYW